MGDRWLARVRVLAEDPKLSAAELHKACYRHGDKQRAFHAAWVLEYIATEQPKRFMPVFDEFFVRLPTQRNRSCQRHFTKILMLIAHPKAPSGYREAFLKADKERVIETVFDWLIDPETPVAVQVNCLDVLYYVYCVGPEYDWIAGELKQQIDYFLRDGSAAMQSRGKKIRAKLNESNTG